MLGVRFLACWKFFMHGESEQLWIITGRSANCGLQVYLIENEEEKPLKQKHYCPENAPKQTTACGLAMCLWGFCL